MVRLVGKRWLKLIKDRKPCGCDQHWLPTDMSETELILGRLHFIKRKRDGKRFIAKANPSHGRVQDYVECRCMECPNMHEHTVA